MEGPAGDYITHCSLFFILGAGDELAQNLRKTAVRISMRLNSSIEYLLNIPIIQLMELVEEILEADEECRKRRKRV